MLENAIFNEEVVGQVSGRHLIINYGYLKNYIKKEHQYDSEINLQLPKIEIDTIVSEFIFHIYDLSNEYSSSNNPLFSSLIIKFVKK